MTPHSPLLVRGRQAPFLCPTCPAPRQPLQWAMMLLPISLFEISGELPAQPDEGT